MFPSRNSRFKIAASIAALVMITVIGCGGEEEPPSRDVFPIIKERLFTLQEAVKERNAASVDSLLADRAVQRGMDADSLMSFVYGAGNNFPFERFGEYDIVHTDEIAQVVCYIMDSAADSTRPMRFLFQPYGDRNNWQIRSFESWMPSDMADDYMSDDSL